MGVETRRGRGGYYYRKVWVGGRCRSVYVGSGLVARLSERLDRERREAAPVPRVDPTALALLSQAEAYCDAVTATMRAHLEGSGYRRHKRGEWRRRRGRDA